MSKTNSILEFVCVILIVLLISTFFIITTMRVSKVTQAQESTYTTEWKTVSETRGYNRTVLNEQLNEYLDSLSFEGYTIFKVEVDPETGYFTVIAYKNNLK